MTTEENQPQMDAQPKAEQAEVETPQPVEPEVKAPSEAEAEPQVEAEKGQAEPEKAQPSERTFTQEEWSKREAEVQKQVSEATRRLSEFQMQQQIADLERTEQSAQAEDDRMVDDGQITQAEADKRRSDRTEQREQKAQTAREMQIAQGIRTQAEQLGRVLAAQDFSKQYNLSEEQHAGLLSDKEITGPHAVQIMETKAANLALENMQGELKTAQATPQKFDQGLAGTTGPAEPESAKGKIKAGWREIHK